MMNNMPEVILPPGLDAQRQWYLYEQIRPFCNNELAANMTCPLPSVPKPGSCEDARESLSIGEKRGATSSHLESETKPKRPRSCGYCKETGHFKSKKGVITCPKLLEEQS